MPPTPSAMSSDSAPVGIASTRTCAASSPIFMIEPCPNSRSICPSALFSADSRALAAFSCSLAAFSCSLSMSCRLLEIRRRTLEPRPKIGQTGVTGATTRTPVSDDAALRFNPVRFLARPACRSPSSGPLPGAGGLPRLVRLHPAERPPVAQPALHLVAGERRERERGAPPPPGVGHLPDAGRRDSRLRALQLESRPRDLRGAVRHWRGADDRRVRPL